MVAAGSAATIVAVATGVIGVSATIGATILTGGGILVVIMVAGGYFSFYRRKNRIAASAAADAIVVALTLGEVERTAATAHVLERAAQQTAVATMKCVIKNKKALPSREIVTKKVQPQPSIIIWCFGK